MPVALQGLLEWIVKSCAGGPVTVVRLSLHSCLQSFTGIPAEPTYSD